MSRPHELQPDELELVTGGSDKLFSSVSLGAVPSHNYGLISNSFGANMSYDQANTIMQQFNAPTRDALYGQGNDPNASFGQISRPGAQDLHAPFDSGGNVTLQHGDGYAINTTVDFQHPLEGTITRNLVTDFHDGGGYQVLTLGQGHGGSELATTGGAVVGAGIGGALAGWPGAVVGGVVGAGVGQNGSHLVNPGLGDTAFSQLDNAMLAYANGTHNPNLDAPSGRLTELGYLGNALQAGAQAELGLSPTAHGSTPQQETLFGLAHDLNSQGPVTGSFALSTNNVGVYHFTPDGSKYYEMENGHVVEKQVDEMSGVDAAIAHQAALNADHPQSTPEGDIHLPDPPAPITGLPPELTPPHDGNDPSGPDHTDNPGVDTAPADADHASGGAPFSTGSNDAGFEHPGSGIDHSNDVGFVHPDSGIDHSNDVGFVANPTDHSNDAGFHAVDPTPAPAPIDTAPPAPIVIDTPPPAPIEVDMSPPMFSPPPIPELPPPVLDIPAIPVSPPVNPGVDSPAGGGGFDAAGVPEMGFDAGGFGGGFDAGGFGGGFDGGGGE